MAQLQACTIEERMGRENERDLQEYLLSQLIEIIYLLPNASLIALVLLCTEMSRGPASCRNDLWLNNVHCSNTFKYITIHAVKRSSPNTFDWKQGGRLCSLITRFNLHFFEAKVQTVLLTRKF
jgi:hypothetical protein